MLLAGALASPLSLMAGGCALLNVGIRSVTAIFALYGCCIALAVLLYVRSQPRLPRNTITVRDLVRAIARQRREAAVGKRRIPPLVMTKRYCSHGGYDLTGNLSGVCPECGTPL